jgi:hypothetical protein
MIAKEPNQALAKAPEKIAHNKRKKSLTPASPQDVPYKAVLKTPLLPEILGGGGTPSSRMYEVVHDTIEARRGRRACIGKFLRVRL